MAQELKAHWLCELEIQHAAVGVDERERIGARVESALELAQVAFIIQGAEMTPVHFETFTRVGLHPHKRAGRVQLRAHLVYVVPRNAAASAVAEWAEVCAGMSR